MNHRQGKGVGDAEDGDDNREGEQGVDQVEDGVDLAGDLLLVVGLALHGHVRVAGEGGGQGVLYVLFVGAGVVLR
ncbi:hypothetical protein ACGF0D_19750 [Kitasatospora sp. NPDC048298]|uniref:hypothetical protein n=1 Tax=Kitasatospora sp. NPDC048298 TaxID=3364049 RepID=UPI003719EAE5